MQVRELEEQTQDPDFYSSDYSEQQPILDKLQEKQDKLFQVMQRWDELESMQQSLQENR